MQSLRLMGIGDLRLMETPIPTPAPGEVLVKIAAAGICGTDRHLTQGEFPCTPPVTLGHEFSGYITDIGDSVTTHQIDDLITCDPNIACGTCPQCLSGRVNLCQNLNAIGIHRDGGFADYASIPAHRALILPHDLSPKHAAFCEPLACCIHGIDKAAIKPGQRVTILGGGVIGLLTLQLAKLSGAEVMLITRQQTKRDLALSLGAIATAATPQDAEIQWPQGADVVIECAGVAETVTAAPHLAKTGGRIVILGVLPKGEIAPIEPFDLLFREIDLAFAFLNPFTHGRAAEMIAAGRIQLDPLITRCISLKDAGQVISNPALATDVKVLILPD